MSMGLSVTKDNANSGEFPAGVTRSHLPTGNHRVLSVDVEVWREENTLHPDLRWRHLENEEYTLEV